MNTKQQDGPGRMCRRKALRCVLEHRTISLAPLTLIILIRLVASYRCEANERASVQRGVTDRCRGTINCR